MEHLTLVQKLAALLLPLIFAITVHEAAHGWVADRLGDHTARSLGRITLNPLKHIDWVGTVLLPMAMFALTGFMFGWAKPVPVDPRNLHNPRRDMALVAVAGPGVNLLMALIWSVLVLVGQGLLASLPEVAVPLVFMGAAGVFINVILMALNLIPLPPLDGGRVVTGLLPLGYARAFAKIEPYGLPILIGLLVTGLLGWFLWPIVQATIQLLPASGVVFDLFPLLIQ
ncbi:MAG: site-2 protease family protein [Gammaproteobacteria bacterium]|jgi:Zn-dependent protease